jgi:signal transduction histidine kinase
MDRKRFALALIALAAGLGVAWLTLTNDVRQASASSVVLVLGIGWSFIASGLVAWQLRPANPIGPVMIVTGFLRFAAALGWSQHPLIFSIGHSLTPAYLVGFVYVLLAFPGGRLVSSFERLLFGVLVVAAGPLHVAWYVFGGHHQQACAGCPDYAFELVDAASLATTFEVAHEVLGGVAGLLALGVLVYRWRHASAPLRFAIAPILWAGMAAWVIALYWIATGLVGDGLGRDTAERGMQFMLAVVAVAFLVGVARTRLARSAVADLVVGLGDSPAPGELQAALGRSLHDPSLRVAYWLPGEERFVDAQGSPVDLSAQEEQVVTMIERDGRRIAALVHDAAALEDEQLVKSAGAAAGLHLDNERLQAELRAQLSEVEASRARIVEAAQTERRRIERDLHDGAQQRLVSVAMSLGLAESKVAAEPEAALTLVGEAKGRLIEALEELRALSQGIHPGILTERGLSAALVELTQRVEMPVALEVSLTERLPERVEAAAYYVVSEALTNVVKHAHAMHARVQVDRRDGAAVVRVSDDGAGGADATRGSGLRGLRDRVEALGGQLIVVSPPGRGTVLEVQIPCAS